MLPHYLAKLRSSSFGIYGRKCKRKCNMHWFLNTHPILIHLAYLLTCFNFRFLLNILCKQQTILSKQLLWTDQAAFAACLAWHWPDHHWQCSWRVAWTSAHVCGAAGKRRTFRGTIVTIFNHMAKNISVFVKCDTIFTYFFGNYHKFKLLNFSSWCGNILKVWWEVLYGFCWKFTSLSRSERILKIRQELTKLSQSVRYTTLFWDTVYVKYIRH